MRRNGEIKERLWRRRRGHKHDRGGKWLGWNPASNSEGGEGFVVREVQGGNGSIYVRAGSRVAGWVSDSEPTAGVTQERQHPVRQPDQRVLG